MQKVIWRSSDLPPPSDFYRHLCSPNIFPTSCSRVTRFSPLPRPLNAAQVVSAPAPAQANPILSVKLGFDKIPFSSPSRSSAVSLARLRPLGFLCLLAAFYEPLPRHYLIP